MSLAPRFSRHPSRVIADALAAMSASQQPAPQLRKELESLAARLVKYEGNSTEPQPGCYVERMTLGDAEVLVEFECELASGDGWNEPRHEGSAEVIGVHINGCWCDPADVLPAGKADAWAVEAQERWADEAAAAAEESRAEA